MSWFYDQASEAIRHAGGRMTEQRHILIILLESAEMQLDVEMIYQRARSQDSTISLATVYRTLSILESAGLIQQRYPSRDHERRLYERVSSDSPLHFTCRRCHHVIPFHSALLQELSQTLASQLGLKVLNACVCLDGLCANCQRQSDQQELCIQPPQ